MPAGRRGPGEHLTSCPCVPHRPLLGSVHFLLLVFLKVPLFLGMLGTGPGMAFFEFDGYCPEYDLAAGEELTCDTGVLAMMDETCTMDVRMVKGAKNLLLGGEGLVDTVITGPGKVYLQTMTVSDLAKLIIPFIPEKK